MRIFKFVNLALGIALLAGCGSAPEPTKSPVKTPAKPVATAPRAPVRPAPPPFAPEVPKPVNTDACNARDLQYLVGRPKTDIPVPIKPALRRVVCSTCAMTMDFNPERQTILFDTNTGLVTSVRCG